MTKELKLGEMREAFEVDVHLQSLGVVTDIVCQTCNGHGMIGGPSFSQPDEGGVPCPDCNSRSVPASNRTAPFANCQFRECDLPGQCKGEGRCHHPVAQIGPIGGMTDAEINELTQHTLGKWPSFGAQSWACKVVHAVLARATVRGSEDMRDAERYRQLRTHAGQIGAMLWRHAPWTQESSEENQARLDLCLDEQQVDAIDAGRSRVEK